MSISGDQALLGTGQALKLGQHTSSSEAGSSIPSSTKHIATENLYTRNPKLGGKIWKDLWLKSWQVLKLRGRMQTAWCQVWLACLWQLLEIEVMWSLQVCFWTYASCGQMSHTSIHPFSPPSIFQDYQQSHTQSPTNLGNSVDTCMRKTIHSHHNPISCKHGKQGWIRAGRCSDRAERGWIMIQFPFVIKPSSGTISWTDWSMD